MATPAAVSVPNVLTDPGYLFIAPLASTLPNVGETAVTAGAFEDAWPVAWLPLGATTEGSTFNYSSSVEPIRAAEFFDPIKYVTTERSGNIAFNLMDFTLANYRRAMNGGVAALAPSAGAAGPTAVYKFEPVEPGDEVRVMIGWESLDNTMRLILRQTMQGGEVSAAFQKAPTVAAIPCTFNIESPVGGDKPFVFASTRG